MIKSILHTTESNFQLSILCYATGLLIFHNILGQQQSSLQHFTNHEFIFQLMSSVYDIQKRLHLNLSVFDKLIVELF